MLPIGNACRRVTRLIAARRLLSDPVQKPDHPIEFLLFDQLDAAIAVQSEAQI